MPAVFLGHGSPLNTLQTNRYTAAWRALGAAIPRPRAVLAISAHWFINATAVTAMERPRTIHDFFGFPPELFAFQYPAPGAAWLCDAVVAAAEPTWIGRDLDSWGLDHGTWSVLAHVLPAADVPVVQLSVDGSKPFEYHVDLGARLAPLREEGVLILGSGNIVHNLRRLSRDLPEEGFEWAHRFDADVRAAFAQGQPGSLRAIEAHPDYLAASPTPDHFLPLLYLAGLAEASGEVATVVTEGYALGALSMTGLALGLG